MSKGVNKIEQLNIVGKRWGRMSIVDTKAFMLTIYTETDLSRFLETAKQGHYYALFYTYLFTGMRRSELLAVRWCDVDLLDMQISVSRTMQYLNGVKNHITFKEPKSKTSRRLIALSPSTVSVLEEHRKAQDKMRESLQLQPITENDLVFSHWDGRPLLPDSTTHA